MQDTLKDLLETQRHQFIEQLDAEKTAFKRMTHENHRMQLELNAANVKLEASQALLEQVKSSAKIFPNTIFVRFEKTADPISAFQLKTNFTSKINPEALLPEET